MARVSQNGRGGSAERQWPRHGQRTDRAAGKPNGGGKGTPPAVAKGGKAFLGCFWAGGRLPATGR